MYFICAMAKNWTINQPLNIFYIYKLLTIFHIYIIYSHLGGMGTLNPFSIGIFHRDFYIRRLQTDWCRFGGWSGAAPLGGCAPCWCTWHHLGQVALGEEWEIHHPLEVSIFMEGIHFYAWFISLQNPIHKRMRTGGTPISGNLYIFGWPFE